jgi:hypothetical protein
MRADEWVIMPNHFHGIVIITDTDTNGNPVGAHRCAPLPTPKNQPLNNPSFPSVNPVRCPHLLLDLNRASISPELEIWAVL